jgi:hypothetical protein
VVALQWLLRQPAITAQMVNKCAQQLLAICCVPLAAAEALVAAGLRMQITGQQLVEAAYSCVAGLDVWVAAFDSAGVPRQEWAANLPLGMRHLCCLVTCQTRYVQLVFTGSTSAMQSCVAKVRLASVMPLRWVAELQSLLWQVALMHTRQGRNLLPCVTTSPSEALCAPGVHSMKVWCAVSQIVPCSANAVFAVAASGDRGSHS